MKKIAVLGSGLLGGSMALAVQKRLPALSLFLWGRRDAAVAEALAMGVQNATSDLSEAVKGADMVILATPVGVMVDILKSVSSSISLKNVIISDVGSVKLTPRETLEDVVKEAGAKYIGSHPMAGSEQAGISAARENLFDGAACVVTNDFHHSDEDVSLIKSVWEGIGCHCYLTTSEDHDRVMARISHFPHMLASLGAVVGLKHSKDGKFAGNGMRDTTRVASGHPEMWTEIMMRNKESLKAPIEESILHLRELLDIFESSNDEKLMKFLNHAKILRDQL